jgi:hypothetical protein
MTKNKLILPNEHFLPFFQLRTTLCRTIELSEWNILFYFWHKIKVPIKN